ncbi:MAG: DUF3604 domain-containing protein, partial [Verrucomicrobiae bacterium]|nr:DUF3604 domain-containing protein [Verrucomicrobiae bacterium]
QARRSVAATDKIYVEFSANGQPLGSIFQSAENPVLTVKVDGTAPLKRITIVRNETDLHSFTPDGKTFETNWTDDSPVAGENRYYLRVEQTDGNMAWASPIWFTRTK